MNYQSDDDTFTIEYGTDGMTLAITYMDSTQGWVPTFDEAVADVPSKGNQEGIFGYGEGGDPAGDLSLSNLVSNAGVVATDVTGVGTARRLIAACEYGGDKGIFGFGFTSTVVGMTNLVSNAGVVATDVTAVGTARGEVPGACGYGGDKGIFGFGYDGSSAVGMTNLVSNAGVVATDVTAVGTARNGLAACSFN